MVWIVADATVDGSETGTSFRQALRFKDLGFNLHDTMIYEQAGTGAKGSNKAYWQSFEYMFVLTKGTPKTVHRLSYPQSNAGKPRGMSLKAAAIGSRTDRPNIVSPEESIRSNVWRYSVGQNDKTEHPAVFPEALAKDHILSWSDEGDLVYDPFMGSGTTAKAAHQLKRQWLGSEISSEYVAAAMVQTQAAFRPACIVLSYD